MNLEDEELLRRLNYAVFGVRGDNGILGSVDALRQEFNAYVAAEEVRRKDDIERQRSKDRTIALTAISALVSALGIIVTLVVVLVTQT